jgi:hypothetical protein
MAPLAESLRNNLLISPHALTPISTFPLLSTKFAKQGWSFHQTNAHAFVYRSRKSD